MKRLFILCIILSICITVRSQDTMRFFPNMAIPIASMTIGSIMAATDWGSNIDQIPYNWVQENVEKPIHLDNHLQYIPAVAVYGLKLCGLESKHSYLNITSRMASSYLIGAAVTLSSKSIVHELRPNGKNSHSFPSGHTMTAFTGAQILYHEYGEEYPWIAVGGYTLATLTGIGRIYNNYHWLHDVIAGAGLGIFCVEISYWICNKWIDPIFAPKSKHTTPETAILIQYDDSSL